RPGQWHATRVADARLEVLATLDHAVSRRGAYHLYVGSGEYPTQLRLLDTSATVEPGGSGAIRLHLPVALPLLPGDRFVLRESGRQETVGGGELLDVAPVLPATRARPSRSVERVIAERGWVDADELERLTGERRPPDVGRWVVAPDALARAADDLRLLVEAGGALGLDVATLDDRHRAVLPSLTGVTVGGGRVRSAARLDPLARHPFVAALDAAPFSPPEPGGVDRAELRELVRRGLVVERDGCY